jgi:hypothetical protein
MVVPAKYVRLEAAHFAACVRTSVPTQTAVNGRLMVEYNPRNLVLPAKNLSGLKQLVLGFIDFFILIKIVRDRRNYR